MFLSQFDIDKLPWLYVVIAGFGGIFAYLFTKVALRTNLKTAVTASMFLAIAALVAIWYLLGLNLRWMLYVFNVFVSLFSITLVSQGWLVAANVFTTREAKRVYGLLGLGAVIGAAFGGSFTANLVHYTGPRNLLLASAVMVLLGYGAFLGLTKIKGVSIGAARAAGEEEVNFSFGELMGSLARYRHLQVIISIILLTYIVDVMVEYQFNAAAKLHFEDNARQLTAFLGNFYGIWLNLATFVLQFFLTAFVVTHFGVGGALQIMPAAISVASAATFLSPGVSSTGAMRLSEAATRYTFNKTGMELLYLPLPTDLKNRTKAFVDIFADRFSRGIGGVILVLLTVGLHLDRYLPLVVLGLCVVWSILSIRAKNEYVSTVRKRLEMRRLDLEGLRVNVREARTVTLLEAAVRDGTPRQAAYAISLLAEAPGYRLEPLLEQAAGNSAPEVRAQAYGLARERKFAALSDRALAEIRSVRAGDDSAALRPAVEYAMAMSDETPALARRLLDHPNHVVAEGALEALTQHPDAAQEILTSEWIAERAGSPEARRRVLAAIAIRVHGDADTNALHKLITDPSARVAQAACRSAGALLNRSYLDALLQRVAGPEIRGAAVEALAAYGVRIVGTLGDVLLDDTTPVTVRRQIPRVLQRIVDQRSVNVLMQALDESDLSVRSAVLRGLNHLREASPKLHYGRDSVMQHVLREARCYYELNAALSVFRDREQGSAARLLAKTLEDRLARTLERLFRLLGLRYPPKEIYAAYLAIHQRRSQDKATAALEFLDNVLERELKRVVLPLLDDDMRVVQSGRELYGIDVKDVESAVRDLIRSGDAWLTACAVATAAELQLRQLASDISVVSKQAGSEVTMVARSALAALA